MEDLFNRLKENDEKWQKEIDLANRENERLRNDLVQERQFFQNVITSITSQLLDRVN